MPLDLHMVELISPIAHFGALNAIILVSMSWPSEG